MKPINTYTKKELKSLPLFVNGTDLGDFDGIIILPTNKSHDSRNNRKLMEFIPVKNTIPICIIKENTDMLHIDGLFSGDMINNNGWKISCLSNGLLYLSSYLKLRIEGNVLSDLILLADL